MFTARPTVPEVRKWERDTREMLRYRKKALQAELLSRGVFSRQEKGDSGRSYFILEGTGGKPSKNFVMDIVIAQFLPLAIEWRNEHTSDGRWNVMLWVNPSVSEYLKLWDISTHVVT